MKAPPVKIGRVSENNYVFVRYRVDRYGNKFKMAERVVVNASSVEEATDKARSLAIREYGTTTELQLDRFLNATSSGLDDSERHAC